MAESSMKNLVLLYLILQADREGMKGVEKFL
jgi:hypothetical protein